MLLDFATVAVFLVFTIVFVFANLFIASVLAPRAPSFEKSIPYECGEVPVGSPWIRFNPRYYVFALIFVIFDVEIAFMYPCAVVLRDWVARGAGWVALSEIFLFLLILLVGLVYAWKRGDLEWIKTLADTQGETSASPEPGRARAGR